MPIEILDRSSLLQLKEPIQSYETSRTDEGVAFKITPQCQMAADQKATAIQLAKKSGLGPFTGEYDRTTGVKYLTITVSTADAAKLESAIAAQGLLHNHSPADPAPAGLALLKSTTPQPTY